MDNDSIEEWYKFFNEKGLEALQFLIKRKQRKIANMNKLIECKTSLESHKDTPSFATLTSQLNKVLEHKDLEIKQRKRRKYSRDTNDYRLHQTFKWQLNLKQGGDGSVSSSPDREVRIISPERDLRYRTPEPGRSYEDDHTRHPRDHHINPPRPSRDEHNEPRTPKQWWKNEKQW